MIRLFAAGLLFLLAACQTATPPDKLVLKPGEARDLSVNLKPGKYQFYCPVDGHKGKGMTLPLTVE